MLYNMSPVPLVFAQSRRERWRVVYNGTLTPRKGVVSLLQAWPKVQTLCPEAELHLYGKDTTDTSGRSMRDRLLSLLSPGLRVTFHGHVPRAELDAAVASARVCVFPSIGEAFGLAPVDAMATGCPTIFSNRCAGPEIIEHGRSGLLIDPERPEEIAAALVQLLTDDRTAASFAQEGWKRVREKFSVEALLPSYEAYYRQCLEEFSERATA
jgi:glycogen synthase